MNKSLHTIEQSPTSPLNAMTDYQRHHTEYLTHTQTIRQFLPYREMCFNPYPLAMPQKLITRLERLSELLLRALRFVATSYIDSQRMQTKMPLPERLMHFLMLAQGTPYHMGSIRPDLLFGKHNEIKLCEINARFPLNGMTLSQWINQGAERASYLSWNNYHPIKASGDICAAMLSRFCTDQPLVRVASSEIGGESRFFLSEFQELGGTYYHARPEELHTDGISIMLDNKPVNSFILEIDREELLHFDDKVIDRLICNSNHINDVRTLILIHDKRILSLISDPDLMLPCLSKPEHDELLAYLLSGANLHNKIDTQQVLENKDNWVLKKHSGGRGIDLYLGKSVSQTRWEELINNNNGGDYMAQEYLEPNKFPILHRPLPSRNTKQENKHDSRNALATTNITRDSIVMNIVGSLPCFDGKSFGPGMFRASELDCVNVGDGKGQAIFLACIQQDMQQNVQQDIQRRPEGSDIHSSYRIRQAIADTPSCFELL